jgi:hypothetical protein
MMEIIVPESYLKQQREVSSESFPPYRRDRLDVYGYDHCVRNPMTLERSAVYIILQSNCNPDFDW